ncbi:MAG: 30S ribosomal protein S17 [Planctomycetaceae bacterium]|nr:30S ribosomal protein S17 [Planctomycetaceae bacterium]
MKKKLIGTVTSNCRSKTLRVEIARRMRHPKYGKIISGRTVCQVHDEQQAAGKGDLVEIEECPPRSKTKRWELVSIVKKAVVPGDSGLEDSSAAG